jgi:anti-sigma B factor antagonist
MEAPPPLSAKEHHMSKGTQELLKHINDSAFALSREAIGGTAAAITVHGELDMLTVPELRTALGAEIDAGIKRIVLDLTDVGFIDSVSLAAIVNAKRRLGADGGFAVVIAPDSYTMLIFEIGGMDSVVEVFATRADAVAHLAG